MKKVYVITGATSGIGNLLVKHLADDNIIFAGYRNEDYVIKLKKISSNVIPFYIDMEKKSSIRQAVAYIKSKTKCVDTLINAAGCAIAGAVENLDIDEIRKQFEVNTFSHLDLSQRLLSVMEDGKIINISSMASFAVYPFIAPYCASKRALDILFNNLAMETNKVKVVSIKPGVIATPFWSKSLELNKKVINNPGEYEKQMQYLVQNAKENEKKGLNPQKVVDLIAKVDKLENPKPSYTIGNDAKFAEIFSKLPQCWINKIVKSVMIHARMDNGNRKQK